MRTRIVLAVAGSASPANKSGVGRAVFRSRARIRVVLGVAACPIKLPVSQESYYLIRAKSCQVKWDLLSGPRPPLLPIHSAKKLGA